MEDWKLEAHAVVKLYRKNYNTFVSFIVLIIVPSTGNRDASIVD